MTVTGKIQKFVMREKMIEELGLKGRCRNSNSIENFLLLEKRECKTRVQTANSET